MKEDERISFSQISFSRLESGNRGENSGHSLLSFSLSWLFQWGFRNSKVGQQVRKMPEILRFRAFSVVREAGVELSKLVLSCAFCSIFVRFFK